MKKNLDTQLLRNVIGCEAAYACSILFPFIENLNAVALMRYPQPPTIQTRAKLTVKEIDLASKAAEIRKTSWFSYLEILLELSAKADFLVDGILDAVNYHHKHSPERVWVSKTNSVSKCIMEMERSFGTTFHIALCSRVLSNESNNMHIPMLDFHVEKTSKSFEIVKKITRILFGSNFIVLETNRSFHSFGLVLKRDEEFKKILANSLLFAPIVDNAYVAHQLIEGEATLRISKDITSKKAPIVVAASNHKKIFSIYNINSEESSIIEESV